MAKPAPITDEQEPDEREVADNQASQDKLDEFLRAFDTAASPQQEIRARALQARRFAFIPGAQWEGEGWEEFSENMIRVEVNKTRKGLRKIFNDYRQNRVTVDFKPVGDQDEETAETLDGRFRMDVYRSQGGLAFDNGFDEGTAGGMGGWRLCNDYEDQYDPDNDNQVINIEPIVDADQSIFFDPNSKKYDKSDAKWGCVITAVARRAFIDEYGDDRITEWPQGLWKPFYPWFTPDVVRVCEWYQVEEKTERLWILTNAVTDEERRIWANDIEADDLNEMLAGGWKQRGRSVKRRRVHKYKLSGAEILKDCGYIAGPNIPIVVYYGERRYIDNQEHFDGHVQRSIDTQRIYNAQISRLVETAGTSPIKRPYFFPEQVAGHEDELADRSRGRKAYNLINPLTTNEGELAQVQGPVAYDEPPGVDETSAALLQITSADIADLSDAEDGADEVQSNVSHEAMDLAATRTDEKSSGFMDNFCLSMEWTGRVYLGMAKEVYTEEGREIATRSTEGQDGTAIIAQPKSDNGRFYTANDFASGKFNVVAAVTESSKTKRDKTVRKSLGIAQIAGPETPLGQGALITAVTNMDGEGIDDLKALARKQGLSMGLFQPNEQEQQEMAEQQQGQQPAPAETALLARAQLDGASAALKQAQTQTEAAKTVQVLADAHLKNEQAGALGGPEKAPEVPSGLSSPVEDAAKIAGAKLHLAQADKIVHDIHLAHREHGLQTIKTGHQIEMERRQQDLAEKQPANEAA